MNPSAGGWVSSGTAATALAYIAALLLGLSVIVGLLCLMLQATNDKKITLRKWLALAWLASLVIPALAEGAFLVVYLGILRPAPGSIYYLDSYLGLVEICIPIVTFLLTMLCLAWLTGHMVLRPLTAMSQAARQIAGGDLNITLPEPPLHEVAEVAEAFTAMGKALRASIERESDLEQERRLFVSAIAHDLRTPLFSLRGYLEGLDRGLATTPEKTAKYIHICQEQADTLEHLVADLFTYARLEYLEQTPQREPLELGTLLRTIVDGMRPRAEAKAIAIIADASGTPCPLEGDSHLLTRTIENLLDNALHYTPAGGCIHVRWRHEHDRCVFSVSDSGPGFAAHELPHLFMPLYRGEASRNRQTGGAGLGLAIARRILLAHGGDLRAANGPLGGAELTGYISAHTTNTYLPERQQVAQALAYSGVQKD